MNYYPEQLRQIVLYCEALNEAEEAGKSGALPLFIKSRSAELVDADGGSYGHLVDEIGGSWSWDPT